MITLFGAIVLAGWLGVLGPAPADATHANVILIVLACMALAVSGAADNISSIFRSTMMQAAVPDTMRGRLQGIFTVVVTGGPRLGALWCGLLATLLAEWFPPLLGGMIIVVLIAVLARLNPRFRAYDAEHPEP